MRKTKEILRHKWALGLSHREVAQSVGVSVGAVWLTVHRAGGARGVATLNVPNARKSAS